MKSLVDKRITEVSSQQARRHVARTGCGGGVYTTLGVDRGQPLFLSEHVNRLRREAAREGLPQLPGATLHEAVAAVLRLNRTRNCVIRLGWLSSAGVARPFALCERPRRTPKHIVLQVTFASGPPLGRYGKSSHQFRWQSLREQALRAGVFDVLVTREGQLTETSRFNVILELNGLLCTPPDSEVFCGIARATLLADPRVATRVTQLSLSDLVASSRVLLVNSVRGLLEVSRVLDPSGETLWQRKVKCT